MVREWRASDGDAVPRVVKAVYDEYGFVWDADGYHSDLYDIPGEFAAPNRFWVAEADGEVVGTCGLELFPAHPEDASGICLIGGKPRVAGADCEIVRLYVLSSARGLGLGRLLAQTAVDQARTSGCARMEIWSDVVFTQAHGLYGSLGARVVGRRKDKYPEEYEEFALALDL